MNKSRTAFLLLTLGAALGARAPADEPASSRSPYAPYAFLIGNWDFGPEGGGPAQGRMMWNGARKNLDMLLALDLNGLGGQEQGTLSIQPDGTAVREITSIGPAGAKGRFRQTFKSAGSDRILTSVLRESPGGWVATFPGSDRLAMTRHEKG